ncbi:MAG TPA: glycerophosphodiester phosphodiesterase family protein, partial [Rhodothermales bacterium]
LDWDVETFELWTYVGSSVKAARCDHDHFLEDLPTAELDTTKRLAPDGAGGVEWVAGGGGSGVAVPHLLSGLVFPIIAHRFDMNPEDGFPENTTPAARQAMQRGAHGVEFDVIRSSEGTWWVMHDTTVTRTTNGTGNVSAKTDAQMAALIIDGGLGYDAGRHAALSLHPPTLDEILDAVLPYDPILYFDLKEASDEAHEALAQYIVDNGLVERSVLLGITLAGCEAAHTIAPTLEIELPAVVDDDPQNYDYIDRVLSEQAVVTNAAYVEAREPDPVDSYIDADLHYGEDETAYLTNMWERGVRAYMTNDLPNALLLRNEIVLAITGSFDPTITAPAENDQIQYVSGEWVNSSRRFRPVTHDFGSGPELVWDGNDLVMEWFD